MPKKIYDLTVKTGEYEVEGQQKSKWLQVGNLFVGDDGRHFLTLYRWFNPGGLPDFYSKTGKGDIIYVNCFEPRPKDEPVKGDSPVLKRVRASERKISDLRLKGDSNDDHASRAAGDSDPENIPF